MSKVPTLAMMFRVRRSISAVLDAEPNTRWTEMETRDQNLCSGKEVKSMHHNFPIFRIFFDLVGEERTHAVVESNVT